jgi:hypothetical protein
VREAWDTTMAHVVSKIRNDPSLLLGEIIKAKRSTRGSQATNP